MTMSAELLDLVLPNVCVCCGRPSTPQWCAQCRPPADVRLCAWPREVAPPIPVWAAADYAGAVRQALLCYKERGRRRLAAPLAELLFAAVRAAAGPVLARPVLPRPVLPRPVLPCPLLLVPVPSSPAAARERGGDHMLRLADTLARLPAATPAGLEVASALRFRGRAHESVGLSESQRATRATCVTARPPTDRQASADVLIVDDIATTGSTLAACAVELRAGGWRVRGAAVVAHTPRLRA